MSRFEHGVSRIYYEEDGSGEPQLLLPIARKLTSFRVGGLSPAAYNFGHGHSHHRSCSISVGSADGGRHDHDSD